MSNTTHNIRNEYTSLAKEGNLHDFTVAELYDVGDASFAPHSKGIAYTINNRTITEITKYDDISEAAPETQYLTTKWLYSGANLPTENGTYYIPLPQQQMIEVSSGIYKVIESYNVSLDANTSTGMYKDFAESSSPFVNFTVQTVKTYEPTIFDPMPEIINTWNTLQSSWATLTDTQLETLASGNIFSIDNQDYTSFINNQAQTIYSIMTTTDTKLVHYLDEKYKNEVEHRFFKSLNVTGTKDNIFYKIIDSNPTDTIDKVVLFKDPNGRFGNDLYDVNDWAPYNSQILIYKNDGGEETYLPGDEIKNGDQVLFTIPGNYNDVVQTPLYTRTAMGSWDDAAKYAYTQVMQIRFKRMLAGDTTSADILANIRNVAAIDLDRNAYNQSFLSGSVGNSYTAYYEDWKIGGGESITISANGNVVFGWTELLGTPQTCTVSNWTSRMSLVNPQHLSKTNKRVISPSMLNDFAPFAEWYKATRGYYPSGEIRSSTAAEWFNTLNFNQFGFWINPYTKDTWTTMSYDIPGKDEPLTITRGSYSGQWNGIDNKYIAPCGGYNQIIWGCGLSPDFMYPVVDISRPTPNTKTECLVYCNEAGYYSIKLAFVTASVEEYLLARFKPNVNTNRQRFIVNDINEWAKTAMIFPEGIKCAYFANDESNVLNCSGFRVAYIPKLVHSIDTVSTILCVFIGILCLIICFVIIKRYVENNRINIGIMRANGISKWKIGLSMLPFALMPAVIGGISAYLVGLFMQAGALSLFKHYWTLPTPFIAFDWVSFLACIVLPFLVFGAICFIATLLVLRTNSVDLMKSGSEFKTNSFSRIAKRPFRHFGVITRFRVSLAFNSITRLLMLAGMSCLTMSSLVFAMTTFDKLSTSRTINSSQFDYKFNVELTTPTSSGSVFSVYDYSKAANENVVGFGYSDPANYIFNESWDTTNWSGEQPAWGTNDGVTSYKELTKWYSDAVVTNIPFATYYRDTVGANGNLMLPTTSDAEGQNIDLLFLQNKTCSKLTLDHNIGVPGLASSNPWEIALALMPANSRNMASDGFNQMINQVGYLCGYKHHDEQHPELDGATYRWLELCKNDPNIADDDVHFDTGHVVYRAGYEDLVDAHAKEAGKWMRIYYSDSGEYYGNSFNGFLIYNPETKTYVLNNDITVIGQLFMGFNADFLKFITTIYTDLDLMKMEYPITYGCVPLNWNHESEQKLDETYTYVSGKFKQISNHHHFDPNHTIKIEGIQKDSQYIKLTNKKGKVINDLLFDENYLSTQNLKEGEYPIIVNAYAAHKYKLRTGSWFKVNVTNTADRYIQKIRPTDYPEDYNHVVFRVVGISQGTNDEAYYTTQKNANDILGLPNGETWNKTHKYMMWSDHAWSETVAGLPKLADLAGYNAPTGNITTYSFTENGDYSDAPVVDTTTPKLTSEDIKTPVGFNGIYTSNPEGKPITNGLSLYSYTGMYPGTSVFKSDGNNKFESVLAYGANLAIANLMVGDLPVEEGSTYDTYYKACQAHLNGYLSDPDYHDKYIVPFINKLVGVYGETTMITSIAGAMDVAASDLVYSNLISTFNLAETSIMSIIIPITIIIVTVVSNLIITDSKKMAAMMKALGYSDAKNLMSILALFVPTIIIGLGLAVPLSFGLTLGYQSLIFNSANILVDVTQKWWYYITAIGGIGVILVGTYAIGYVSMKRDRLVDMIK